MGLIAAHVGSQKERFMGIHRASWHRDALSRSQVACLPVRTAHRNPSGEAEHSKYAAGKEGGEENKPVLYLQFL